MGDLLHGQVIHAFKVAFRTLFIPNFGAGTAAEVPVFSNQLQAALFLQGQALAIVRVHAELGNGISPYRDYFLIQRSCNMHHAGIMCYHLLGLFQ